MTTKQVNSITGIVYVIATIMVLTGAFFRIQHYPHALPVLIFGFMLGTVISTFDNYRLKQKIKRLEEQIEQKN